MLAPSQVLLRPQSSMAPPRNNNDSDETRPNRRPNSSEPNEAQLIASAQAPKKQQKQKNSNRQRNRRKGGKKSNTPTNHNNSSAQQQQQQQQGDSACAPKKKDNHSLDDHDNEKKKEASKPKAKSKKSRKKKKSYPWRTHIPEDSSDPITLEPLASLTYPPFALVASEPYEPVEVWPVAAQKQTIDTVAAAQKDREQQVLQEQWGKVATAAATAKVEATPKAKRHYHLYDGRALAYWMTASNQFIDPLNRRDVVRDELVNLDRYLRRHGFTDLNVTEAYDCKGVTISTAGAEGNTAAGRAAILQQEASVLLNSLFGGNSISATSVANNNNNNNRRNDDNALTSQYQAYEAMNDQQQQRQGRNRQRQESLQQMDGGIYGDAGTGMLVIDDDLNPGLRGTTSELGRGPGLRETATEFVPGGSNTLWSASHIADRYSHQARVHEQDFPSLAPSPSNPAPTSNTSAAIPKKKKILPKVNTLAKIATAVKKTDPQELQRQWDAREAARQRAMLSTVHFTTSPSAVSPSTAPEPSEGQLERNRAFAQALGVAPSTVRFQNTTNNSGWARPSEGKVERDEYGIELNATVYPDALIVRARENMALVLKVEKKLKAFMADDAASSLSLGKMDRVARTLVHHYSDFWRLETESFDPEPNRYIHCTKLQDTGAPYPLLSNAARAWKGPQPILSSTTSKPMESCNNRDSRNFTHHKAEERVPLQLKDRSSTSINDYYKDGPKKMPAPTQSIGGAPTRSMMKEETTERFAALERERPFRNGPCLPNYHPWIRRWTRLE